MGAYNGGIRMKKIKCGPIILHGICAILWILRVILSIVCKRYMDDIFSFVIDILCAIVWSGTFYVNLQTYLLTRQSIKDKEKSIQNYLLIKKILKTKEEE